MLNLCKQSLPSLSIAVLIAISINTAYAKEESTDDSDKAFWLWMEAYADNDGNIMDPLDLSELASGTQNHRPSDHLPKDHKSESNFQKRNETTTDSEVIKQ